MVDSIKQCVGIGLCFSVFYSLYVCGLYWVSGATPFERLGTSLGVVIGTYFFGGITAGLVVGILRPLTRWRSGAIFVGIIAAFFVFLGIGVASSGLPSRWRSGDWFAMTVLPVFFGAFAGNKFWKDPIL